jgi:hypothetical protein
MKSVTERLADKFGGTWEYDRVWTMWRCSDGRSVVRLHSDHGFDAEGKPVQFFAYWLHEPGGNHYEITL